jgi:hypothetical protein
MSPPVIRLNAFQLGRLMDGHTMTLMDAAGAGHSISFVHLGDRARRLLRDGGRLEHTDIAGNPVCLDASGARHQALPPAAPAANTEIHLVLSADDLAVGADDALRQIAERSRRLADSVVVLGASGGLPRWVARRRCATMVEATGLRARAGLADVAMTFQGVKVAAD